MTSGLSRHRVRCHGFSLYDMLITLSIGSALTVGGVGLRSIVQETNMTAAANTLMAHLALARSEAITRRVEVVVCPSRDAATCDGASGGYTWWTSGYLVYADTNGDGKRDPGERVIRLDSGRSGDLTIKTSAHRTKVIYQPTGLAGGSTFTFAFCDNRGPRNARYVTIQNTGRARVSRTTESKIHCA